MQFSAAAQHMYIFANQRFSVQSAPHKYQLWIARSAKGLWGAEWTENLWVVKMYTYMYNNEQHVVFMEIILFLKKFYHRFATLVNL